MNVTTTQTDKTSDRYRFQDSPEVLIQSAQKTTNNYWDNWFATYDRLISELRAKQETLYWQHWFNLYSQKLDLLLHT